MFDLAFVLLRDPGYPVPEQVIASARELGFTLTVSDPSADADAGKGLLTFAIDGGGTLIIALMPPHPDAARMGTGPTSVPADEAAAARAHLILTALELGGDLRRRDARMAALTAAVLDHVPAVGAMLGHGALFHRADLFRDLARLGAEHGTLPAELAVDITAARESEARMSFLSHGLARLGGEEVYVTCPIRGKGAVDFMFGMVRWLYGAPDTRLPTGHTVGRSETEQVRVQRVPSPTGKGADVIRLDLER
ncbi:MAG TPA: hypothetical protein VHE35_08150 [Kofleriaceae bacterium]|nr:hypothetical protein [Kofleriaceae bacterium]